MSNPLCIYIWLMRTWLWLTFVFVDLSLNRFIEALVQAASELYKGLKVVMHSGWLNFLSYHLTGAMLSM